jgi:hypothetical protein
MTRPSSTLNAGWYTNGQANAGPPVLTRHDDDCVAVPLNVLPDWVMNIVPDTVQSMWATGPVT